MSSVTGADDVGDALLGLGRDLSRVGLTLGDIAVARAARLAPTLAQLEAPIVRDSGAILNYSGVIYPDGFARTLDADLGEAAVTQVEDFIDTAIQRAGLA